GGSARYTSRRNGHESPCRSVQPSVDCQANPTTATEGTSMTKVRVLAGTRKGAFILESDAARRKWDVQGPFFGGWEVYHVAGSPADPDRIYASQTSSWFGQIIQRSDDGGRTWKRPGLPDGEAE